jgi:hypothetical protein
MTFIMKKLLLLSVILIVFQSYLFSQSNHYKTTDSLITEFIGYISEDSIQSYIQSLEDFGTRFCLAGNRRDVSQWILDKFISFGYTQVRLDSFQLTLEWPWGSGIFHETWQYNVECILTGHTNPDQIYILGAHHDAIVYPNGDPLVFAPGADDNASGVAAALEIARIFREHDYMPESTIRFVTFAAEELGLHGAYSYAQRAFVAGDDIQLMINNDMISHSTSQPDDWSIEIQYYPNAQDATNLANQVINEYTMLTAVENNDAIQYSDSWPFYVYGFPAVFFIEEQFTPFYHTIDDLVASINKAYAAEVTKISLAMLVHHNGTGSHTGIQYEDESISLFKTFPNPFGKQTRIIYEIKEPAHVDISIYDASGRLIDQVFSDTQTQGIHSVDWHSTGKEGGVYFCKINTGSGQKVIRLLKTGE